MSRFSELNDRDDSLGRTIITPQAKATLLGQLSFEFQGKNLSAINQDKESGLTVAEDFRTHTRKELYGSLSFDLDAGAGARVAVHLNRVELQRDTGHTLGAGNFAIGTSNLHRMSYLEDSTLLLKSGCSATQLVRALPGRILLPKGTVKVPPGGGIKAGPAALVAAYTAAIDAARVAEEFCGELRAIGFTYGSPNCDTFEVCIPFQTESPGKLAFLSNLLKRTESQEFHIKLHSLPGDEKRVALAVDHATLGKDTEIRRLVTKTLIPEAAGISLFGFCIGISEGLRARAAHTRSS